MISEQTIIGATFAVLCGLVLWKERWFLECTSKGQRLVRRFGRSQGAWVLRGFLAVGIILGLLLALDVIRPIQW